MNLPTYDKSKRRTNFQQLPKAAYVVRILNAKEDKWPSGDPCLKLAFDIAEGEYRDFYKKEFESRKSNNEDAVWPFDAVYTLNVPQQGPDERTWTNWNSFFADLEDSNNGFVFNGDPSKLKGKVIGGKFRIKQTEYNGNVYNHTELWWTCVADDVRNGKAGKLPQDKLVSGGSSRSGHPAPANGLPTTDDGFIDVPDDSEEEVPFG